ncbi:MAG: iron-sulfur cluster insertion protein ErpA [Chloroflexi bacterium]|jgi:iron-sulfur cluster assembly accessory protein|nr:iron-sulfur cluster insertion protein ErpA [Chloroflexota bacterium]
MVLADATKLDVVSISSMAADAVRDLLAKRELEGYALRVFVQGGGCSGFQYGMALENNFREEDTVVESNGVSVVIDEVSIQYLRGAQIDYVDDVMGSGFKIENPNAVSSCGCGSSFRTEGDQASDSGAGGCGGGSCGC